jgi:hypothetical protein
MPMRRPKANLEPQRRSKNSIKIFNDTFSRNNVIRELCKERAKLARKRNDKQFLHRIDENQPAGPVMSETDEELENLFPARRKWHRYRIRNRGNKSSYDLNVEALYRAVIKLRKTTPEDKWIQALNGRVQHIRTRALKETPFRFSAPRVCPIEKEKGSGKYRPLSCFLLDDKVIDCLTARYLRKNLDRALRPSCLAFRCSHGKKPPPTIHDALQKLLNLNQRHLKSRLFVAECDIKSFFDCVSHAVAREALAELVRDAKRKTPGLEIHPRAGEIYESYLAAYSFQRNVKSCEQSLLAARGQKGEFKWPAAELKEFHGVTAPENVGVPQGGALSCFIANAVLHSADKSLDQLKRQMGKTFSYLRYCDDMILLASTSAICEKAYECYSAVLTSKFLPVHQPEPHTTYGAQFWNAKSKAPYLWNKRTEPENVPWIQFVGYQIRFDGLVRLRPSTVAKHRDKMTDTTDQLLKALNPGPRRRNATPPFAPGLRKTNRQIIHRLRQKLISMAVGRVRVGREFVGPMPMCWANGLRGLLGRKIVRASLKLLDRHREKQIHRLIRRLKLRQYTRAHESQTKEVLAYYGAPFSYWGQFPPGFRRRHSRKKLR